MADETVLKARIDRAYGYARLNALEAAALQASIPKERVRHLKEGEVYEVLPYSSVLVQGCHLYDFAYDSGKVVGPAVIGIVRNTGFGGLHHRLTLEIRKIEQRHRKSQIKRWALTAGPVLVLSGLLLILGGEGGWQGVMVIVALQVLLYVLSKKASRMDMPPYRPSERLDDWTARVRAVDVPVQRRRKPGSEVYDKAVPLVPHRDGDALPTYWLCLAMESPEYSSDVGPAFTFESGIGGDWDVEQHFPGGGASAGDLSGDHHSATFDSATSSEF